jgi:hypothetical protein
MYLNSLGSTLSSTGVPRQRLLSGAKVGYRSTNVGSRGSARAHNECQVRSTTYSGRAAKAEVPLDLPVR